MSPRNGPPQWAPSCCETPHARAHPIAPTQSRLSHRLPHARPSHQGLVECCDHAVDCHGPAPEPWPLPDPRRAGPRAASRGLRHGDRRAEPHLGVHQPFAGALVDRFGPRLVAISGALLYAAGLAITAAASSATMILIGSGALIGIALSCTTSGIASNVAARVIRPERRSLGFGVVSAAGSMGTFFAAPLGQAIIAAGGWRLALAAFFALGLLMLPAALVAGRANGLPTFGASA